MDVFKCPKVVYIQGGSDKNCVQGFFCCCENRSISIIISNNASNLQNKELLFFQILSGYLTKLEKILNQPVKFSLYNKETINKTSATIPNDLKSQDAKYTYYIKIHHQNCCKF